MTNSRLLPYLLIAPSVVFLGLLFVVPLVQTIVLAFTDQAEPRSHISARWRAT